MRIFNVKAAELEIAGESKHDNMPSAAKHF